ncbi:MAG: EVE domain-containing protein [Chloroflexi bacterium]|nr:EVE domain-containing protein [Chloroflexota bacterium]
MAEPTHWMLVSGADNFERSRTQGFKLAGMKSRHLKKAERVRPGDKVLFYLTGIQMFGGTAEATSTFFEDHTPLWASKKAGESYPYRFKIKPDVILDAPHFLPSEVMAQQMRYAKKWPAQHWRLAFQGNVHVLPKEDFELIRKEMLASRKSKAPTAKRGG